MEDVMHRWFGTSWGAPVCRDEPQVATPVGQPCVHCGEPIRDGDQGVVMPCGEADGSWRVAPLHVECHLRMILGGANHLRGNCTCCGGTLPSDPPGLTRREAALLACKVWDEIDGAR
jgi:hypothetical protein